MTLHELTLKNRSYRKFDPHFAVPYELLRGMVDTARLTASARNLQPLRYKIINTPELCDRVFDQLAWAGYLSDGAPARDERPTAYLVLCNDERLTSESRWDQGIVSQNITLSAVEAGLGACIIASIKRVPLKELLHLPDELTPVLVIALGKPIESVVLTEPQAGDIKYFRDETTHYVPKRTLDEVLIP